MSIKHFLKDSKNKTIIEIVKESSLPLGLFYDKREYNIGSEVLYIHIDFNKRLAEEFNKNIGFEKGLYFGYDIRPIIQFPYVYGELTVTDKFDILNNLDRLNAIDFFRNIIGTTSNYFNRNFDLYSNYSYYPFFYYYMATYLESDINFSYVIDQELLFKDFFNVSNNIVLTTNVVNEYHSFSEYISHYLQYFNNHFLEEVEKTYREIKNIISSALPNDDKSYRIDFRHHTFIIEVLPSVTSRRYIINMDILKEGL